jgi:hypothetical protein
MPAVMYLVVCNWGQIGVKAHTGCWSHRTVIPMNSGATGRWDRNRTGNLRFWSTRRGIQTRLKLSKLPLNWRFLAAPRPESSKHVQPVCSQFCSQDRILGTQQTA